jgi:hypothetical protein
MDKELAVAELRPFRRADRPTVDSRGFHCDKEDSIEALIPRHKRLVTLLPVQNHEWTVLQPGLIVSPFSDM